MPKNDFPQYCKECQGLHKSGRQYCPIHNSSVSHASVDAPIPGKSVSVQPTIPAPKPSITATKQVRETPTRNARDARYKDNPLSQTERNSRYRENNREAYRQYMREYMARRRKGV